MDGHETGVVASCIEIMSTAFCARKAESHPALGMPDRPGYIIYNPEMKCCVGVGWCANTERKCGKCIDKLGRAEIAILSHQLPRSLRVRSCNG